METIYANPVNNTGFPAQAEILETIKDYGELLYCKVKMEDGEICKVFIKSMNLCHHPDYLHFQSCQVYNTGYCRKKCIYGIKEIT